jgi:hypothetical protein
MTILTVGTGQQYSTLAAAVAASHDGDLLKVQAGNYTNDFATINTRITIQGVGGLVNLVATVPPPNGKAILVTNTDVTLDNISFAGTKVADGNGAGIRYQGGNLVINNCYFHDNQDGLLAADAPAGSITINNTEFAHNGVGDGYTHNIYVGQVGTLTIRNSYIHDAVVGHEIKSRAFNTIITNNHIIDGPNGTASYSIDLPNGGKATISGNTIQQGPYSQNPAIIHFGGEGMPHPSSSLSVTGNTILNDLSRSSAAAVLNQTTTAASITYNKVFGLTANQLLIGMGSTSGTTFLTTEPAYSTVPPYVTSDTLVLKVSESGGTMGFIASLDGKALGGITALAPSRLGALIQSFTFKASVGAGPHILAVQAANLTGGAGGQLFVNGVTFDGIGYGGASGALAPHSTAIFTIGSP